MFQSKTYAARRKRLKNQVASGLILFLSNGESPMNYPANTYPFRQESSFLYFFGLDSPDLAAVLDIEENRETIFGNDIGIDDIVWMGPQPSLKERSRKIGITDTQPFDKLESVLRTALQLGRENPLPSSLSAGKDDPHRNIAGHPAGRGQTVLPPAN